MCHLFPAAFMFVLTFMFMFIFIYAYVMFVYVCRSDVKLSPQVVIDKNTEIIPQFDPKYATYLLCVFIICTVG